MATKYGYMLDEQGNATPISDPRAYQRGEVVAMAADSQMLDGKSASEYVQTSNVLTLEEIKASTDLTGKIPAAAAVHTISGAINNAKFDSAYNLELAGANVPEKWGCVLRVRGDNWGPTFKNDSFFLLVGPGGALYTGVQVNGATTITWAQK